MKTALKTVVMVAVFAVAAGVMASEGVSAGRDYFTGKITFKNGGPPCIACHSRSDLKFTGGRLGPSLDTAGENFSVDELVDFLGSEDSPVMYSTYRSHPLTEAEKRAVAQYLVTPVKGEKRGGIFSAALIAGAILFLITGAARKSFFA